MKNFASKQQLHFDDTAVAFKHLTTKQLQKTYLIFYLMNKNWLVKIGTFFIKFALTLHLPIKKLIKMTIFEHFCGGESISDSQNTINQLAKYNIGTILDYSVEGEDDEQDFDKTMLEISKTIEKAAIENEKIPFSVFKVTGVASAELLEKVQTNQALTTEEISAYERAKNRIEAICNKANSLNVRIFIDAEESWIQTTIDTLCYEMMRKYNRGGRTIVFNTYQFYRWETFSHLKTIANIAEAEGFTVGCKFVRGAYMEKERERAEKMNYVDPIQHTKRATDNDFDLGVDFALKNLNIFAICLGTHNEESCLKCASLMEQLNIEKNNKNVFFAQLLGMSDTISFNMAANGYNVAKYVPYGPIEAVMPYLIRRAEENTSIAGQSSREFLLVKKEVERRKKNEITN